jgi:hypothetical protein
VHPDRPAVCFVGDGSFQMALPALAVAAEFGLGVTWVVLDDQALGSIRDIQQHRFDERILATDFDFQPDFAALARACGCHGERVEDAGAVDAAIARALDANARGVPAVLDIAVARERLRGSLEHYAFYPKALVEAAPRRLSSTPTSSPTSTRRWRSSPRGWASARGICAAASPRLPGDTWASRRRRSSAWPAPTPARR